MNQKGWLRLTAALTALLCAALCLSALGVYCRGLERRAQSGPTAPIYTRQEAGRQLLLLSPLAGIWLLSAAVAAVKTKAPYTPGTALQRPAQTLALLYPRLEALPPEAAKEQAYRRRVGGICGGLAALCAGIALRWLLNRAHFVSWDLERVMGEMLLHIVPPLALGFSLLCAGAYWLDQSRSREIQALSRALSQNRQPPRPVPLKTVEETRPRQALRLCLYGAALVLTVLGALNGGLRDVLVKAINICTECIGLG